MKYTITIAADCRKGHVRRKNQDNFWCASQYLDMIHDDAPETVVVTASPGDAPAAAIFDGMGGEQLGEHASYLAATVFDERYPDRFVEDGCAFLDDVCREANARICQHGVEINVSGNMGTTAAMILFGAKRVHIANVGDSRIYRMSGGRLTQISLDHSLECPGRKKAPLTQFLGIPETEFVIEPYKATFPYKAGDRYLLCSDGLTDMVDEDAIASVLKSGDSVEETCARLRDAALEGGGRDNVTVIVCETAATRSRGLFAKWFKKEQ